MEIGEVVTYRGRKYQVRGLDPRGVEPQHVYLEDVLTGRRLIIPLRDFQEQPKRRRGHLRLVEPDDQA